MHIVVLHDRPLPGPDRAAGIGGASAAAASLVRGLAALGHRVTLLAPRGSRAPEAAAVPLDGADPRRLVPAGADGLVALAPIRAPLELPWVLRYEAVVRPGSAVPANAVFLSADHARRQGAAAFVHDGLDPADHPLLPKGRHDLFAGPRTLPAGYPWALAGARRARRPLVVAAGWRPSLRSGVRHRAARGPAFRRLLAQARLLWCPPQWDAPCPAEAIAALMSGTPVLGTRRGGLREIVSPDTGRLGRTLEELVELAPIAARLDADACRARAEAHFTHRAMAEEYLRMLEGLRETGRLPAGRIPGAVVER